MTLRFICTGLLVTLLSCTGASNAPSPKPPEVTTTQPTVKTVTEWDEYTGRVAALHAVEIRARVPGYVQSIRFRDGAMVDQGELLLVIDPRPYEAALRAAEARLERAKAQLETTSLLLKRAQSIRDSGAVSQDTLDERLNNHLVAKAELAAAKAELVSARLNLTFTKVSAPIAGQVGRRLVEPGDLVEAGSTLLTTVVSQDPVYFYFTINERDALHYGRLWRQDQKKGDQSIAAHLVDSSGADHVGHIDFVDNQIDAASGTRELRAVFDNPDGSLVPGMFGTIRIAHGEPHEAMLIPEKAIMADQAIEFVYVVGGDDVVERRDLELGPNLDGMRVIRKGLSADSRIIVEGMQRARPGSPVSPKAQDAEEASAQKSGSQP